MDKQNIKIQATEAVLNTVTTQTAEMLKEQGIGLLGSLLIDTVASAIPGLGSSIINYKTARLQKNIEEIETVLSERLEEIQAIWHSKNVKQQEEINKVFEYMLDNSLEDPQKEKIEYFFNGFINIAQCEEINEDFTLIFYDLLTELRLLDLTVLKLYGRYYLSGEVDINNFDDVLDRHQISYAQYDLVRQNLLKKGLLIRKTDLVLEKDLKQIEETIQTLQKYVEQITNSKKPRYPSLKKMKLKYNDRFELSPFAREFIKFMINENVNQ